MLADDQIVDKLVESLDDAERARGVAYYAKEPLMRGASLQVPRIDATAPFDAMLGFVDRDPTANWGHSCRYVLIDRETGEGVVSIEAQLPPFTARNDRRWVLAYRAPSVPDFAVAVPGD